MRCVAAACLVLAACDGGTKPPTYGDPPDSGPQDAGRDAGPRDAAPADAGDPPLPEPDIEFVLPFLAPAQSADLAYQAEIRLLDLHLLVDTTGSMNEEIDRIQSELATTVAEGIAETVDDVTFGVSHFEDFPFAPFGDEDDVPYELLQDQTTSLLDANRAVYRLDDPLGNGGDFPESISEGLYQVATGEGFEADGETLVEPYEPAEGLRGGVGFRAGALPVVLVATDERTHHPWEYAGIVDGTHSIDEATEALQDLGARVVGVASGPSAHGTLVDAAIATGGTMPDLGGCPTGIDGEEVDPVGDVCPLVFDVDPDGSGLSDAVVDAIRGLLESIVWSAVTIRILDDDLGFVIRAEALRAEPPEGAPEPGLDDRGPVDGVMDTFTDVWRGTRLFYRITARNTRVEPTDYDQIFYLRTQIVGDGETIVDEKLVRIVVPAGDEGWWDAGPDGGLDDAGPDGGLDDASIDAATEAGPSDAAPG